MRCFSAAARCVAVFLAFALLCVPLCPAQSCTHACCPSHSGSCAGADLHLTLGCVRTAPNLAQKEAAGTLAPSLPPAQSAGEHAIVAAINSSLSRPSGVRDAQPPQPPLRI